MAPTGDVSHGFSLPPVSRRGFLKTSTALAAAGGALATLAPPKRLFAQIPEGADIPKFDEENFYWSSDTYNCGGWDCAHKVFVKNGRITRVLTDDTGDKDDAYGCPQVRHCVRGASFKFHTYDPYRVKYPLERTGPRGSGQFKRVSWDYAAQRTADELKRIGKQYGPHSVAVAGMTGGGYGGQHMMVPMMTMIETVAALAGPVVMPLNDTSMGGLVYAILGVEQGTAMQGISDWRQVAEHANVVFHVGANPGTNIFICNTPWRTAKMGKRLKERGVKTYGIEPRLNYTGTHLFDEWIPTNPQSDAALFAAMMYTQLKEGLIEWDYVKKYTSGWSQYQAYLLGQADSDDPKITRWADGVPKTPEWGQRITGIPAAKIRQLAIEFATKKPAALFLGLGPNRGAIGHTYYWAGITMAIVTGNVGKPGNWAGLAGSLPPMKLVDVMKGIGPMTGMMFHYMNPSMLQFLGALPGLAIRIVPAVWFGEMLCNPKIPLPFGEKAPVIKGIAVSGGNLVNCWPGTPKMAKGIGENVEFMVTSDSELNSSARLSDIVLPIIKSGEREDFFSLVMSGTPGVMYSHPLIKPMWESKDDDKCWGLVAEKAGMGGVWKGNFTAEDSVKLAVGVARMLEPKLPSVKEMRANPEKALVKNPFQNVVSLDNPYDAQINHGAPFGTASGKWEIYSETIERMVNVPAQRNLWWLPNDYPGMKDMMKRTPPIPMWVDHWEGPLDPIAAKYPFQMSSPASIRNAHNSFINNPALDDAWGPQVVWLNEEDAAPRGIKNGDIVQIFNDRGTVQVRAFVTKRIAKGVIALENGRPAAFSNGTTGVDVNGAQSTLLRDMEFNGMTLPHAGAFLANMVTHTGRVEVRKVAEAPAFQGDPREPASEGGPWIPNYPFSVDNTAQTIETVNADPKSEAFLEGATWNREKSQGKTADKNVQGYISQGGTQAKK